MLDSLASGCWSCCCFLAFPSVIWGFFSVLRVACCFLLFGGFEVMQTLQITTRTMGHKDTLKADNKSGLQIQSKAIRNA